MGLYGLTSFLCSARGHRTYYLSVGALGVDNEVIQVHFDPLFRLNLMLGSTLDEAIETLNSLKKTYKES